MLEGVSTEEAGSGLGRFLGTLSIGSRGPLSLSLPVELRLVAATT